MKVFFSYVDPGTGLLMWQAIVSAFVGLFFYVKKTRDWFFASLLKLVRIARSAPTQAEPSRQPRETAGRQNEPLTK